MRPVIADNTVLVCPCSGKNAGPAGARRTDLVTGGVEIATHEGFSQSEFGEMSEGGFVELGIIHIIDIAVHQPVEADQ